MIPAKFAIQIVMFGTLALSATALSAASSAVVDHIILGAANLEEGIEAFERLTGVRPAYGGKHPMGTHNALVSLGGGTYLEIIAVQPGASPPAHFAALPGLNALTPIAWAISSGTLELLHRQLASVGIPVTEAEEGSRLTPAGITLHWQTFGFTADFDEAPFFIVWSPESPHPSSTAPTGCSLKHWTVAGPNADVIGRLVSTLELSVTTAKSAAPSMSLTLTCPKGAVSFESPLQQP